MDNCKLSQKTLSPTRALSSTLVLAPLALLLSAGCVDPDPPKDDMAMGADLSMRLPDLALPSPDLASGNKDLATGPADLAGGPADLAGGPADLSTGTPDLSLPPRDMAGGPVVTGLPPCAETGVNADAVFNMVAKLNCANAGCHAVGAGSLKFTSGAELKTAVVGVASGQTTLMPMVTAGSVDKSYLMYKLTDQHVGVMGRGVSMPKGMARLADADLCKLIVWIKEGAN